MHNHLAKIFVSITPLLDNITGLDGSTSSQQRDNLIQRFNSVDNIASVFLLSTK